MQSTAGIARSIPARIDRLPLTREIWRILFLAGIAWLLESYDIGVIGTILPSLQSQFKPDAFMVGLLGTASTVGIVVAVFPAGWLADRIGRKNILIAGTAWYAIFSGLCAFAPNLWSIVILRFAAGFGMGAIFPIPYAMSAEFVPGRLRGFATSVLDSFLSIGYFAAPLLGFAFAAVLPANTSWRALVLIGAVPIIYVPMLMKWLPESPRWLETKGREREAERIVEGLESAVEQRSGNSLPQPQRQSRAQASAQSQQSQRSTIATSTTANTPKFTPLDLFRGRYLKRTLMMWISFAAILFIFYAVQTYTPTVLVKQGYNIGNSFLLTTIIVFASIPGKYAAAYTLEHWGRKPTLIIFTIIAAVSAVLFGLSHTVVLSLLFGCLMSFFGIGVDPAIKTYGSEQYPTAIRATGVSSFEGVGRLFGGVLAPFIMAFLLASSGIAGSYVFVAVISIVGVLAVALLGVETRGRSIEQASVESVAAERNIA